MDHQLAPESKFTHNEALPVHENLLNKEQLNFARNNEHNYSQNFKSTIRELKNRIKEGTARQHFKVLGSGNTSVVYKIEVDQKKYAAKVMDLKNERTHINEITALILAKGLEHVSQIIAYSLEDDVIIMEVLPGKRLSDILAEDNVEYSDEHIKELIQTIIDLNKREVGVESKPKNFTYDSRIGFSIFDLSLIPENIKKERPYFLSELIIMPLNVTLASRGMPDLTEEEMWEMLDALDSRTSEEKKEDDTKAVLRYFETTSKFLKILYQYFPDIIQDYKKSYEDELSRGKLKRLPFLDNHFTKIAEGLNNPRINEYLEYFKQLGFY